MKINEEDMSLLTAFLEREGRDFSLVGSELEQFVNNLKIKIEHGLSEHPGKANYIHILSLGNVGCMERQLTLTASPWGWESGDVMVVLCTCGKPDCWGSIIFPDGKEVGKKGVQLL